MPPWASARSGTIYDGERLQALQRSGGGYQPVEYSPAFPFLRPAELVRFFEMSSETDENSVIRAFLEWSRTLPGG